jgi:hypothetical protein
LPLTLRRRNGDGGTRTHIVLVASEVLVRLSDVPWEVRTGGVEPPRRAATGLQPAELADAQRPRERGDRPDSNRYREDHDLGCCRYTTATTTYEVSGDDRTRTGGLSPDKRLLLPLSYAPGWRGWDSNPRFRAHEAREDSRSSTALRLCKGLAGRSRTCDLRCPRPAGWPTPLQPDETPGETRTRPSGLRVQRHRPSTTGASTAPAAGIEPAPRD